MEFSVPSSIPPRDINNCTHVPAHFPLAPPIQPAPFVPSSHSLYRDCTLDADNLAMSSHLSPINHVMQQFYQLPNDQQEHLLKLVDHPQALERQDPNALRAAINLVVEWSAADARGGTYTIPKHIESALMLRVQRPPAETGPGSRQGCQHWVCLWPGCEKETRRRPNATRHLLSHTEAKPEICTIWYVPAFQNNRYSDLSSSESRFRFPQDLHRHQKIKHSVGPKMVFIKDHPGGVLCEDPGDSFEYLRLTISIGTAIIACSVEISLQPLKFSPNAKSFLYYFNFMFLSSLNYAPGEDMCSSTQDHGGLQLSSNLWMYLLLTVSRSTHSIA